MRLDFCLIGVASLRSLSADRQAKFSPGNLIWFFINKVYNVNGQDSLFIRSDQTKEGLKDGETYFDDLDIVASEFRILIAIDC